jgi:undecaprenyl pyrophosphate synthase
MLEKLKIDFYNLIAGLGFSISDTRNYEDNKSPWLMLRTGGYQRSHSLDVKTSKITLVLDIFSQYNGEREIIQAVEKIADNINGFILSHPEILVCQ